MVIKGWVFLFLFLLSFSAFLRGFFGRFFWFPVFGSGSWILNFYFEFFFGGAGEVMSFLRTRN